jgi:DNA-binding NarL/FixJ family response regulator
MRLAICDEQWLFSSVLSAALAQQGHEVVLTTDEPAVLMDRAAELRPEICVIDVVEHYVVAVAGFLAGLDDPPALVLLTDACQDGVWEAYDQGLIRGVVNKACVFPVLMATLDRVADGERVSEGWQIPGRRQDHGVVDALTGRELEVLRLVVRGHSTQAMAEQLGVSRHTVRTHVQQILRKLGVHGRGKIARAAEAAGLVDAAALSSGGTPV